MRYCRSVVTSDGPSLTKSGPVTREKRRFLLGHMELQGAKWLPDYTLPSNMGPLGAPKRSPQLVIGADCTAGPGTATRMATSISAHPKWTGVRLHTHAGHDRIVVSEALAGLRHVHPSLAASTCVLVLCAPSSSSLSLIAALYRCSCMYA